MKQVSAVSMVQVLAASLSGLVVHYKNRFVSKSLLLIMGLCNALGNLVGSLFSKHTNSAFLLSIFASMAIIAAITMFVPKREQGKEVDLDDLVYNKPLAAVLSLIIYVLEIPTRIVIGSTLGIVLCGAITGTVGKAITGQIVWLYAMALIVGTIPGAQLGGLVGKKISTGNLRLAIAIIIAITGIRMWYQIITEH